MEWRRQSVHIDVIYHCTFAASTFDDVVWDRRVFIVLLLLNGIILCFRNHVPLVSCNRSKSSLQICELECECRILIQHFLCFFFFFYLDILASTSFHMLIDVSVHNIGFFVFIVVLLTAEDTLLVATPLIVGCVIRRTNIQTSDETNCTTS